ncbi:MAG: leucyl/phenylalanyl-tRNA--protein transferase [Acidobacteria bacterium]|nr:leucyl/phenylalanyl-tRNA--protein transferase [Acidobacteriota bacterium]
MLLEPPGCPWAFPRPSEADEDGLVCIGGDLEPGTLLAAYRAGLFPMPIGRRGEGAIGWWSPDPRGVLPLDQLRVTRSLRRSVGRYEVTVDHDFTAVMTACAEPSRAGGWISQPFIDAYSRLHDLGWAHSVETWLEGELVGGLYGVAIGGLFAGESMFSTATDASKVALVRLVDGLRVGGVVLLDVQWRTDHLATLGAIDLPRRDYLTLLADAVARPQLQLELA